MDEFEGVVVPDADDPTHVSGYLVFDRDEEDVTILIDEVVGDGVDEPYDFAASQYDVILVLFNVTVPAAATTLEDLDLIVSHVVAAPKSGLQESREKQLPDREALIARAEEQAEAAAEAAAEKAEAVAAAAAIRAAVEEGGGL